MSPPHGKIWNMESYIMTKKDLKRYSIIQDCIDGIYTVPQAAKLLDLSHRQVQRLKKEVLQNGPQGIIHKGRGKISNKAINSKTVSKIVELKNDYIYEKANFTHFRELLLERENINISYSCLYSNLTRNGIHSPRKHHKTKLHRRRKRKSYFGELVQTDGTPFDWFGTGDNFSLHGFIDDATGIPLGLYMCETECLLGYLEITRQMLSEYGIPETIYSDKFSVFFPPSNSKLTIEEQLAGKTKSKTQFHRILDELNINLVAANSSQAKGRIERLWNTLQDRLVTEFRVNHITTIEQANAFLPSFMKKNGEKFGVQAENSNSKFVSLPKYVDLDKLLCVRFNRTLDNSGCFGLSGEKFQVISRDLMPKSKITVLMSKKMGIKVEYKEKIYDVLNCNDLPSGNTMKQLHSAFKSKNSTINFAIYLSTLDAKKNAPLLVSS